MTPDQKIELYRMARATAWSYKLQQYDTAALIDMKRTVDNASADIVRRFANGLGQENAYTRTHFQNNLKELERLSLALRNQLGEQLVSSTSYIGTMALKEWTESVSVGGQSPMVNTVALSPEQFKAFFTENPPMGIPIPQVIQTAVKQGVLAPVEGAMTELLREGALTGQSYSRIVGTLEQAFTDFTRSQLTTITRTFFQTANTQAFDAVYQANQDIMEGKIWTNSNDNRCCLLCLPLGEVLYKKGEQHPSMPRHPRCRCTFRPKTVSYRSLGLNIDEIDEVAAPVVTRGHLKDGKWVIPQVGTGGSRIASVSFYKGGIKEAFPHMTEPQQLAILGKSRYALYKSGKLALNELADPKTGKLWLLSEIDAGKPWEIL